MRKRDKVYPAHALYTVLNYESLRHGEDLVFVPRGLVIPGDPIISRAAYRLFCLPCDSVPCWQDAGIPS